jgi:hypothetical protein
MSKCLEILSNWAQQLLFSNNVQNYEMSELQLLKVESTTKCI